MPQFKFLGPYRIGKTIGRGGMGTVFSAVHEKTGEKVAVKLISAHVADEKRFRRRFNDEVKTLQQLKHKNIVRLIGFGEEQGQLFYSMELVEGETLQQRIRREKKVSWLPALEIAIDVCAALKHAHDFGVIHRDLKPANLLLSPNEGVKLVDFGIAKIFGESDQTMVGSVLGTADYMAPEQATGSGVTVRTDLYALGNVMYAMLTGRPPFRGKNVTEVITSLKRDKPVPLDMVDANLPEDVVLLVHQLLEKDPELRPPTALAVMNRLKAMRAGLQKNETVIGRGPETDSDRRVKSASPADPDAATDDSSAQAVGSKATVVTSGEAGKVPDADPDGPTVASGVSAGNTDDPGDLGDEVESETRTHFQTVSEAEQRPGFFQTEISEDESVWTGQLAIGGLIAVLVIGTGLILNAMRPPTADQLYADAIKGDDTGAMIAFIKRYPNDSRFAEINNLHMQSKLEGQLRRIETQKALGITPLNPYEEAFQVALEERQQHPMESSKKLEQWLAVYDSPETDQSPNLTRLIELARHEQVQLQRRGETVIIDPRAEKMIVEIDDLAGNEDQELVRKKLTGIIESFRPMDWAEPAVKEAERVLRTLDDPESDK